MQYTAVNPPPPKKKRKEKGKCPGTRTIGGVGCTDDIYVGTIENKNVHHGGIPSFTTEERNRRGRAECELPVH